MRSPQAASPRATDPSVHPSSQTGTRAGRRARPSWARARAMMAAARSGDGSGSGWVESASCTRRSESKRARHGSQAARWSRTRAASFGGSAPSRRERTRSQAPPGTPLREQGRQGVQTMRRSVLMGYSGSRMSSRGVRRCETGWNRGGDTLHSWRERACDGRTQRPDRRRGEGWCYAWQQRGESRRLSSAATGCGRRYESQTRCGTPRALPGL